VLEDPEDTPLLAPVSRQLSWTRIHELSQGPRHGDGRAASEVDADHRLITRVRRSATIRRGTRMKKIITAQQLAGYLAGRLISGFCHRAGDLAELRTAAELSVLTGAPGTPQDVVFALRWRAVDAIDYHIPFTAPVDDVPAYPGLSGIPPHERVGPAVLGTGFAPSRQHLIPEFVTAEFADLPLPANSTIVAHTADGDEVPLYSYLPEQRAWLRLFGPQWRTLLAGVPGIAVEQEYIATAADAAPATRLVGQFQGGLYDAVADPPHEFRVLARGRAFRYLLETMARRTSRTTWRGVPCTVVRAEGDWMRLRLCRPDAQALVDLGAQCVERGVYEAWAPVSEVPGLTETEIPYVLA
jgi:hypothetical protein